MKPPEVRCCELCKTKKGIITSIPFKYHKSKVIPAMEWCIKKSFFNGFIKLMEEIEVERETTIEVFSKVKLCHICADLYKGTEGTAKDYWWEQDELGNWYRDDGAKA